MIIIIQTPQRESCCLTWFIFVMKPVVVSLTSASPGGQLSVQRSVPVSASWRQLEKVVCVNPSPSYLSPWTCLYPLGHLFVYFFNSPLCSEPELKEKTSPNVSEQLSVKVHLYRCSHSEHSEEWENRTRSIPVLWDRTVLVWHRRLRGLLSWIFACCLLFLLQLRSSSSSQPSFPCEFLVGGK